MSLVSAYGGLVYIVMIVRCLNGILDLVRNSPTLELLFISAKYFNQEVKKFNNSTKKLFERISNGFFKVQVTQEKVMLFRDGELPPWLK